MDYARLLPWLAWTLLTYTCVDIAGKRSRSPFRPADAASTEAAAETNSEWIEPAVQDYIDDLVYQGTKAPQVLMVLDPNGVICWENVDIDDFTNATLLPWLHSQHDALTLSNHDRSGRTLQVSSRLLCMGTLHVCAQVMSQWGPPFQQQVKVQQQQFSVTAMTTVSGVQHWHWAKDQLQMHHP